MITTVTQKGQVTIPKKIRELLNIRPNDKVDFRQVEDKVILVPIRNLQDFRGTVPSQKAATISKERKSAKNALADRLAKELE